jgi:hypothetical protein
MLYIRKGECLGPGWGPPVLDRDVADPQGKE